MLFLDIGEVVERTGVPPSTLRYYEEIGLIRSLARHGLRRQYDHDVLLKLSLISMGKAAGFSLPEISGMFGRDDRPDIPRAQLHARAKELERQIIELRMLRDVIRHVADCPAPSHLECPSFRKLLKSATNRTTNRAPQAAARRAKSVPQR
ncbi:helix-turn-helix domain-containing protein [Aminobacter carboxidus]|uniref:DNA-binding transcriptional MerR regulator n=1 Tax=Aminobacter carboxidus TaxID=376165 RepID=A0A8E1WDP8_9HYPH|nr:MULTISPECIES: helix-turn-helix domain-containing protein [Aminobacter carboxidus group]MBB6466816.1 DNA-binding transcriptional MerR regulator [Aminobacter lissarensis]MBE1203137.1 helix-turn-helix domain-containing protein [Aminobacter carboxidus]